GKKANDAAEERPQRDQDRIAPLLCQARAYRRRPAPFAVSGRRRARARPPGGRLRLIVVVVRGAHVAGTRPACDGTARALPPGRMYDGSDAQWLERSPNFHNYSHRVIT